MRYAWLRIKEEAREKFESNPSTRGKVTFAHLVFGQFRPELFEEDTIGVFSSRLDLLEIFVAIQMNGKPDEHSSAWRYKGDKRLGRLVSVFLV
jgi:hypothetical protein